MRHQERIQNPLEIDQLLIERSLNEDKEVIVQFSDKLYDDRLLDELNTLCLKYDEYFTIRFYGHHRDKFDCKIIEKIPNVKSLNVDCLTKADNVEYLKMPQFLKRLSLGIYELKDTEILNFENFKNLEKLVVTETKTKALNLVYLKDYLNLSDLIICGHAKNIDALGNLKNLASLGLNSISKVSLEFINQLSQLKTLNIALGGRENILEIKENTIENLNLIWIRGFNDLSNIGQFKKLKMLSIEDNIRLKQIVFDKELINLTYIKVINCKTLSSITGLEKPPALNHLRIYKTNIDFDEFIKQARPPSLSIFAFYTAKTKIDKVLKDRLKELGYTDGLDIS